MDRVQSYTLTVGLLLLCPFLTTGQNEKFDTHLTLSATNISFFRFPGYSTKYSYHPIKNFNIGGKIFLSKNYTTFIQGGYLEKKISSHDIYNGDRPDLNNWIYLRDRNINYTLNSIITNVGLQRYFTITDNFETYFGLGITARFDLKYKKGLEMTDMSKDDSITYSWNRYWTELTAKNNKAIGICFNYGVDLKFTKRVCINANVQYSYFRYYTIAKETINTKTLDLLTNTTTETTTTFDPSSTKQHTYPMSPYYFGSADLIILIGLTYKVK